MEVAGTRQITNVLKDYKSRFPCLDDLEDVPIESPTCLIHSTLSPRLAERLAREARSKYVVVRNSHVLIICVVFDISGRIHAPVQAVDPSGI
jgi:hypothetical protein